MWYSCFIVLSSSIRNMTHKPFCRVSLWTLCAIVFICFVCGLEFGRNMGFNPLCAEMRSKNMKKYHQTSNISSAKSPYLNVSRLVLQVLKLSLHKPFKPGVKSRMKVQLEQRRQAMLQLHLSDQQFYCLWRCCLYYRFDGIYGFFFSTSKLHMYLSSSVVYDRGTCIL